MQTHFISLDNVRETLQVIEVMKTCGDPFEFSRPASLSTADPHRHVGGAWKTPVCRKIESILREGVRQSRAH